LLGRHEAKLSKLREGSPFLTMLRVQLVPVVPFGMLNYAAGTARLPFFQFWSASGLAIIPSTIAAVYVGDRIAAGVRGRGTHAFVVAGLVMVGLFVLSFLPGLLKREQR
jgi:uncharacterized membrane protein YdjX (TVP38/TMEM64 family)